MKSRLMVALLITGAMCLSAFAQGTKRSMAEGAAPLAPPERTEESPVYDDDGGRVFVVRRNEAMKDELRHHGGPVIEVPQEQSIFLGSAWSKPENRARQARLTNLLASLGDGAERAALKRSGVQNTFMPAQSLEALIHLSNKDGLTDLGLQKMLAGMFERQELSGPEANTIYVVYLAPGIGSTLGTMMAGKHYVAYHNFFHTNGQEVHYVVVPFETDAVAARTAATRALVEAIVNPTGDGWY